MKIAPYSVKIAIFILNKFNISFIYAKYKKSIWAILEPIIRNFYTTKWLSSQPVQVDSIVPSIIKKRKA